MIQDWLRRHNMFCLVSISYLVSLTWLAHTSEPLERVKVAMGVADIFPGGATWTCCWSFSGWSLCNANGRSQNALLFLHHKKMPHESTCSTRIYFEIFFKWSCRRVWYEFMCTFYHPLQILWNWRINVVIIVNSIQVSLKWTWIINNYVCGSLISLCWWNKTRFWNLLSELFFTLPLSEMLIFINCIITIFASTFYKQVII